MSGTARAMVVISKNANVATGAQGMSDAREVVAGVAAALGCAPTDVLIASTGVIGRAYPMDRIRAGLAAVPNLLPGTDAQAVAEGIMTTDTVSKTAEATVAGSDARVVGVAKGVGMIEPNMATMISMVFTDAAVSSADLDRVFRRVADRTYNCVSVDTDTSTSDTTCTCSAWQVSNGILSLVIVVIPHPEFLSKNVVIHFSLSLLPEFFVVLIFAFDFLVLKPSGVIGQIVDSGHLVLRAIGRVVHLQLLVAH